MSGSQIRDEVQDLYDRYIADLTAIARKVQLEVVNPFCDRHGLWFVQRMNAWGGDLMFGTPGNPDAPTSSDWNDWLGGYGDHRSKPPTGYACVREIIDEPVPGQEGDGLRFFMQEYKPERKP